MPIDETSFQDIKDRVGVLEGEVRLVLKNHIPHIEKSLVALNTLINDITIKLSTSRPSWPLATLITFLACLCVGLLVSRFGGA